MVLKAALTAVFSTLRYELVDGARVGVRIAITQAPTAAPLIARPADQRFESARFSGAAAAQMSRG